MTIDNDSNDNNGDDDHDGNGNVADDDSDKEDGVSLKVIEQALNILRLVTISLTSMVATIM